jgi:hypothetical protein
LFSYVLVGAAIGMLGSVLIAGGQLAGLGSGLRRSLAIGTGLLLMWVGLMQVNPRWLPSLPFLHPVVQGNLHDRLGQWMSQLAASQTWIMPVLLGLLWGVMPCGFLYAAQIKAAATGSAWQGGATMLAFGLGTLPMMLGIGSSTAWLSRDRRGQLFRMGGWVTLTIGLLTLLRTSEMHDYAGHAALSLLMLALIARPIQRLWAVPMRYRRALGVGAFILSLAHISHTLQHSWNWNLTAINFLLPQHQWGMCAGIVATLLLVPAAGTSFDAMVKSLGPRWRTLHLLTVPALGLAVLHACLVGSSYLGDPQQNSWRDWRVAGLVTWLGVVLCLRSRRIWAILGLKHYYTPATARLRSE